MKKIIKGLVITVTTFVAIVTLAACVPKNLDKAKSKLEKAGYDIIVASESEVSSLYEGLDSGFYAEKGEENIMVLFFTSTDVAKEFYDEYGKEEIKDGFIVKRSGKIVYAGTETAVKDFD